MYEAICEVFLSKIPACFYLRQSDVRLSLILSSLFVLVGCVTPGPIFVRNVSQGMPFAETSVAVVPTDDSGRRRNYVVAFNNYNGGPAWGVSTDGGDTWTRRLEGDTGFSWGRPAEVLDPTTPVGYAADPTLVLTSFPNQVAYVQLAYIARVPQVVIAISTDGGSHFGGVHLVSTGSGKTEQPVAALNVRTGEIWVAWTQMTPSPSRIMIRKLHYDSQGVLTFDMDPKEVAGLPGLDDRGRAACPRSSCDPVNMTIAAGNFHGQTHVALAYADKYENGGCEPLSLNYYLADSIDGAQSWQTTQIAHDDAWPQCVTDSQMYNRNRPAVGIANSFVIALTQSSPTGSRVHVYFQDWPLNASKAIDAGSWPPDDPRRHDQFGPALAVSYKADAFASDARVRGIAVTWHDTRFDSTDSNLEHLIYGATSMGSSGWKTGPVSLLTGTVANEQVPWITPDKSNAGWGDYEGLAADNFNGTFVAAWADNRARGDSEVWAAVYNPF